MFNIRIGQIGDKFFIARRKFFHPYWGWEIVSTGYAEIMDSSIPFIEKVEGYECNDSEN